MYSFNYLNQIIHTIFRDTGKKLVQQYSFDFFNYAGIHRPVVLYTTPIDYISDITINTDIDDTTGTQILLQLILQLHTIILFTGIIDYKVKYESQLNLTLFVKLIDKFDNIVLTNSCDCTSGTLYVPNANFWWPYLMNSEPGYLYTLEVRIIFDFP